MLKLEGKEKNLLGLLSAIPPDFELAEQMLQKEEYSTEEITKVALNYVEQCFWEKDDFFQTRNTPVTLGIVPNLHSTYIVDVIKLLLEYGLNPNAIYNEDNIMYKLHFIDNEFLAADTLALLLEHGGKTDLNIPDEVSFFDSIDFDVFFDAIEQYNRLRYASMVHYWMVMIGYGARCGEDKMQVFKEYNSDEYFNFDKLKNHRNYFFGITYLENDFAISIFDKDTLWEVARIK